MHLSAVMQIFDLNRSPDVAVVIVIEGGGVGASIVRNREVVSPPHRTDHDRGGDDVLEILT